MTTTTFFSERKHVETANQPTIANWGLWRSGCDQGLLSTYPKSAHLQTAAGTAFAYRTPRDQVLSVTAVLAARSLDESLKPLKPPVILEATCLWVTAIPQIGR